jgi:hypothetical protein
MVMTVLLLSKNYRFKSDYLYHFAIFCLMFSQIYTFVFLQTGVDSLYVLFFRELSVFYVLFFVWFHPILYSHIIYVKCDGERCQCA